MNRVIASTVFALLVLVASASCCAAGPVPSTPPLAAPAGTLDPLGPNADYAIVDVGAQAPDFSFEAQGRALRLHDLRLQGHVLLLIAPDDGRLLALERERPRLLSLGVVPVAVLDEHAGACAATARRLGLDFALIPDPRRVIGAQFNALDPSSGADAPAWFVLDRTGRVRDLAHFVWPARPWWEISARALGLPGLEAGSPASFDRRR